MIKKIDNYFIIETSNLSYIIRINEVGYLLTEYFGDKIILPENLNSLGLKEFYAKGTSTIVDKDILPQFSSDTNLTEYSFSQKGDYKEPAIILRSQSHGYTFDFRYLDFKIEKSIEEIDTLPSPYNMKEELVIILKDTSMDLFIELHYQINEEYDVIVKNVRFINKSEENIELEKIASLQLDIINKNYELVNLNGGWITETHKESQKIHKGIYINDSKTGNSSNRHNPFFIIKENKTNIEYGECYGFNLIYSGNHQELVELSTYDHLHIQTGINPHLFHYNINPNDIFITPFALLSYSSTGTNLLSQRFHNFINNCVVNSKFNHRLRPVLINNWEGTYFKFDEAKLLSIAKTSKRFGIELFALDDGWFSNRNDDEHGLGDYDINKKKLTNGLNGLAKKINKIGLKFGLWFEPEGVNLHSKIFENHPEFAVHSKFYKPSEGRNELILDLTKNEVQDYIINNVSSILESANIEYVKWDMNRNISDICFNDYDAGEFYHRYILGLYKIIKTLVNKFPNVLFENCASGGNRFDLGMLRYFPQTWASDDSDGYERLFIQEGLYCGYPLSSITCHVSHKSNHQLLRNTPYSSKFNVACFGVLGYELMLNELNPLEQKEIKNQIQFYKEHRELFQYGTFYILKELEYNGDSASYMVLSKDKQEAIISIYGGLQSSRPTETILKGKDFLEDEKYLIQVVDQKHDLKLFGNLINMILPVHVNCDSFIINEISKHKPMDMENESYIVSGSLLNKGIILKSEWAGNGYSLDVRVMGDFGSRLYYIKKI